VVADRGELDSDEARQFFTKFRVQLTLTTAYNLKANGKIERGHGPILKALVKACDRRMKLWPQMLPYALWVDRTTHSTVTGYMPAELMTEQIPMMPVESSIVTWSVQPWKEEMSPHLEVRPKDVDEECRDNKKCAFIANKDSIRNIVYGHGSLRKGTGSLCMTIA
jgi:hypothetical protein